MDTSEAIKAEFNDKKCNIAGNFAVRAINKVKQDLEAISFPQSALQLAPEATKHFNAEIAKLSLIIASTNGDMDKSTEYAYYKTAVNAVNNFASRDESSLKSLADKQIHLKVKSYKKSLEAIFNAEMLPNEGMLQNINRTMLREIKKHAIPFEPAQG